MLSVFLLLKQQGYLIYSRSFGDADSYPSIVLPFASGFYHSLHLNMNDTSSFQVLELEVQDLKQF